MMGVARRTGARVTDADPTLATELCISLQFHNSDPYVNCRFLGMLDEAGDEVVVLCPVSCGLLEKASEENDHSAGKPLALSGRSSSL